MTSLKKNLDRYMQLKGIKMYSHLLVDIAHQLGIHGNEAYIFAEKEKANFSLFLLRCTYISNLKFLQIYGIIN